MWNRSVQGPKGNSNFGLQVFVPNSLCVPYTSILHVGSVVFKIFLNYYIIVETKTEQRYTIKYCVCRNLSPAETIKEMKAVYGGKCCSNHQIEHLHEFCEGHLSAELIPHTKLLLISCTQLNINTMSAIICEAAQDMEA